MLSDDALYAWIMDMEEQINASGAYLRESEKWYGEARSLDLGEMMFFEQNHMESIEWTLNDLWPLDADGE